MSYVATKTRSRRGRVVNITFTPWIQEQYAELAKRLPAETLKLLELAAQYEGYESPAAYVEHVVVTSLKKYSGDLRFGRWLKERRLNSER